jgi:acetyl esterase
MPPGPAMHEVTDVVINANGSDVIARRYRPTSDEPAGTVVYFHSGGWVTGNVDTCDPLVRRLALASVCE